MTLEKSLYENDNVFDQGDFKIVISNDLDGRYERLEIDYLSNFLHRGFTISEKGNRTSSCC